MKRSYYWLRWINIFVIIATLLVYVAPSISPAFFWPMALLGVFFPTLVLLNLLFILLWLGLRNRYFLMSLITLFVGFNELSLLINFNSRSTTTTNSINISSYNIRNLSSKLLGKSQDQTYEDFSIVLLELDADIMSFQEFSNSSNRLVKIKSFATDKKKLDYEVYQPTNSRLAIWSRYPILKKDIHFFTGKINGYQWADIKVDSKTFRLFNLHLQSNAISSIADDVAANGNINDKKTWQQFKSMIGRFKRAVIKRADQAEQVAEIIKKSPHPVIVMGDLNDVPQSYSYRLISNALQDTFREKGNGMGFTYVGPIPGLRIDYIFADPKLKVLDFDRGNRNYSDHRPVSTTLGWD